MNKVDVASVIMQEYKKELLAECDDLLKQHEQLDSVLGDLIGDIGDHVMTKVEGMVEVNVFNGFHQIQTRYDGCTVDLILDRVSCDFTVIVGEMWAITPTPIVMDIDPKFLVRIKEYRQRRHCVVVQERSALDQLRNMEEKEGQLKGKITEMVLVELGLDHLLDNPVVKEALGIK